jgi:hypothetical protein
MVERILKKKKLWIAIVIYLPSNFFNKILTQSLIKSKKRKEER